MRGAFGVVKKTSLFVGLIFCSKGEIKGGPLADGPFGPDGPAVSSHNSFYRRQSDACAFEVLGPMQPLKNAEQFVGILHVEADSIVSDKDSRATVFVERADLDDRPIAREGVLDGVGQQIGKDLSHQTRIALDCRQR